MGRSTIELEAGRGVDCRRAFREFLGAYPRYRETDALRELRQNDFARLDAQDHVYLDYTGGGLYGASQVSRHAELLQTLVLGNPHSGNPSSETSTRLVEECRAQVARFFNASPQEYVVIFTANASHALKLVGESYPFSQGDQFLLTFDNHNSVNGIREYDRVRGADTVYVPVRAPDMRVDERKLQDLLKAPRQATNRLFAYPAQSNFSGVQHPLEWIDEAQREGWDVLLDAAAYVPTNRLDLGRWHPDYVALSFYKMFGYPTGVGALLARRRALKKLHRPWFAGGTIRVASVQADRYLPADGSAAFEDGTLNYTSLPAVSLGLEMLEKVGVERLHQRVSCLVAWVLGQLGELKHSSGVPLVVLYGPRTMERRGATVAFNFQDPGGNLIDHRQVERAANRDNISLRTGCFCNPGSGEAALGLSRSELDACFSQVPPEDLGEGFRGCLNPERGNGAVRISFGWVSTFRDAWRFLRFAQKFLDRPGRIGETPGSL